MSDVATTSSAIDAAMLAWNKVDSLVGGTVTMRKAGGTYLPKWPKEAVDAYHARRDSTFLFNAFGRTLNNLAGKPFKEPMSWTDTPPEVEAWFEDFDMAGRKLDVFGQEVFTAALAYGLTHVLADVPPIAGLRTKAEELAAGVRPYAVHIKAPSVLGWKSQKIAGVETLTQFRYMECVTIDAGQFGSAEIEQVRVLEPGKWSTYRKKEKETGAQEEWALFEEGTTSRPDIPLVTFYTLRTAFMRAVPPLEDLADLNIEHWQSSSDQRSILHVARVPILAIIGVNDSDEITIGAQFAVKLPLGADAKYVEHSGAAIGAGRQDLLDLEERMRLMGAELLVKGPGRVSATQAALDTSQQQSYLASLASRFEDFLDEVVVQMAAWTKLDVSASHIDVFKDFGIADFDNTAETLLLNAVNAGRISNETFFDELKRRGTLNSDIEWQDEEARIANQAPIGGMALTNPPSANPTGAPNAADAGGAGGAQ